MADFFCVLCNKKSALQQCTVLYIMPFLFFTFFSLLSSLGHGPVFSKCELFCLLYGLLGLPPSWGVISCYSYNPAECRTMSWRKDSQGNEEGWSVNSALPFIPLLPIVLMRTSLDSSPLKDFSKICPFQGEQSFFVPSILTSLTVLPFIAQSTHPSVSVIHPFTVQCLSFFIALTTLSPPSWSWLSQHWVLEPYPLAWLRISLHIHPLVGTK
jgi:hypothetical protein